MHDVSQPNEGPFDKRIFPPKWAFDPITEEDYQKQKEEYETTSTTEANNEQ